MITFSADQQNRYGLEVKNGCVSGLRANVVNALSELGASVADERPMWIAGIRDANTMTGDISADGYVIGRMMCYRSSATVLCTFTK